MKRAWFRAGRTHSRSGYGHDTRKTRFSIIEHTADKTANDQEQNAERRIFRAQLKTRCAERELNPMVARRDRNAAYYVIDTFDWNTRSVNLRLPSTVIDFTEHQKSRVGIAGLQYDSRGLISRDSRVGIGRIADCR